VYLREVLTKQQFAPLFSFDLNEGNTLVFNLSRSNQNTDFKNVQNAAGLSLYLHKELLAAQKNYGVGGYAENRIIYKRFSHFNNGSSAERHHHLGVDVWAPAYTDVFCPLPGEVHSFAYNGAPGDYGGTLILRHQLETYTFYSLYGHLSMASLLNYKVGQLYEAGAKLGQLGDVHENVDWPPHLHFQLIKEIGDYVGDYPGVCTQEEKGSMLANCPNPNLILKLAFLP